MDATELLREIRTATSVKGVHLAYGRAVRRVRQTSLSTTNNDHEQVPILEAILQEARDKALERIQQEKLTDDKDLATTAQAIHPQIFLGPFAVARNPAALQHLGITHILCLSAEGPAYTPPTAGASHQGTIYTLNHPLVEVDCTLADGAAQLVQVLPSSVQFVEEALRSGLSEDLDEPTVEGLDEPETLANSTITSNQNNNVVLIHCLHGKTRSAAIAACVLAILQEHGSFEQAYEHIQSCRDVLVPEEWHGVLQTAINQIMELRQGR